MHILALKSLIRLVKVINMNDSEHLTDSLNRNLEKMHLRFLSRLCLVASLGIVLVLLALHFKM